MSQSTILKQTILDELGIVDLPEERKEKILVDMMEVILKRLYIETMEKLSEEDRGALMDLLDNKAEEEKVEVFLREKIENYDDFVKKVVDEFKAEIKEDLDSFGGADTEKGEEQLAAE
ncbi:MAG: DUF5663 domain-containing protein [Parcubacteria group bacterium]|jgi:hypothetical protein